MEIHILQAGNEYGNNSGHSYPRVGNEHGPQPLEGHKQLVIPKRDNSLLDSMGLQRQGTGRNSAGDDHQRTAILAKPVNGDIQHPDKSSSDSIDVGENGLQFFAEFHPQLLQTLARFLQLGLRGLVHDVELVQILGSLLVSLARQLLCFAQLIRMAGKRTDNLNGTLALHLHIGEERRELVKTALGMQRFQELDDSLVRIGIQKVGERLDLKTCNPGKAGRVAEHIHEKRLHGRGRHLHLLHILIKSRCHTENVRLRNLHGS